MTRKLILAAFLALSAVIGVTTAFTVPAHAGQKTKNQAPVYLTFKLNQVLITSYSASAAPSSSSGAATPVSRPQQAVQVK
jgi:hypothetical protein